MLLAQGDATQTSSTQKTPMKSRSPEPRVYAFSPVLSNEHPAFDDRWHWVRTGFRTVSWGWVPHLLGTLVLLALLVPSIRVSLGALVVSRALWAMKLVYVAAAVSAALGLIEASRIPAETGVRPLTWSAALCFLVSAALQISSLGTFRRVAEQTTLPLDDAAQAMVATQWLLSPLTQALAVALFWAASLRVAKVIDVAPPRLAGALMTLLFLLQLAMGVLPQVTHTPRPSAWMVLLVTLVSDVFLIAIAGRAALQLWMAPRPHRPFVSRRVQVADELFFEDWVAPRAGLGLYAGALRAGLALLVLDVGLREVGAEVLPAKIWGPLSQMLPLAGAALALAMAIGLWRFGSAPREAGGRAGAREAAALFLVVAVAYLVQAAALAAGSLAHPVSLGVTVTRSLALIEHTFPLFAMLALTLSFRHVAEYVGWPEIAQRAMPIGRLLGVAIAVVMLAHLARFTGLLGPKLTLLFALATLVLGAAIVARHLGVARLLRSAIHQVSEPPPEVADSERVWEDWERSLT